VSVNTKAALLCGLTGCLIIEVHDHRPPIVAQSSAFPTPPINLRLTNGTSTPSGDEATTSIFNSESSARALGGNYGFQRRLGIDARRRNGDSSSASGTLSPSVYRIVLYPSAETLWTDLRMLNEVEGAGLWKDEDVLEIESRILVGV
jgi:transcription factor SPT20